MKLNDDKKSKDHFVLSTGKTIYANNAILGISAYPENKNALFYGYDGQVFDYSYEEDEEPPFTTEERKEISEYMINLWKEWVR